MKQLDHSKFDHVGLVTDVQQPNESRAEATRLSSTNPRQHPYRMVMSEIRSYELPEPR